MFNNVKTMDSYNNLFFNKKLFMMTKKSYLYDIFFVSNRNFTTEHIKIVKTSGYSRLSGNPVIG